VKRKKGGCGSGRSKKANITRSEKRGRGKKEERRGELSPRSGIRSKRGALFYFRGKILSLAAERREGGKGVTFPMGERGIAILL